MFFHLTLYSTKDSESMGRDVRVLLVYIVDRGYLFMVIEVHVRRVPET